MVAYFDASALVKLVVHERETPTLRGWLRAHGGPWTTSLLGQTELLRAVRRADPQLLGAAPEVLRRLHLLSTPASAFRIAGLLDPPELRSLDAVHLATALQLADELTAFVSYDQRLADAASQLGLPVAAPA